jgi:hypothetical protein
MLAISTLAHRGTVACPRGAYQHVQFVCAYKPHKADPYWVHVIVGGDRVYYPHEVATKTADLPVTKVIINSVISTKVTLYINMHIKNCYFGADTSRSQL